MTIAHIYYTQFNQPLSPDLFKTYLHTLPTDLQHKVQRFVRWQDQHASLFARLLLQEALQPYQLTLQQIRYTEYQRPYIYHSPDFNVAHSGEYVICAIMEQGRIGIDIEKIRPVEMQHFTSIFSSNQQQALAQAANKLDLFFKFWTQKESAIKADGRGLNIELDTIESVNSQVQLEHTWFLHEMTHFLPDYACHLATDQQDINVKFQQKYFYE